MAEGFLKKLAVTMLFNLRILSEIFFPVIKCFSADTFDGRPVTTD